MLLEQRHISNLMFLKTRPQHLARMLPRSPLIREYSMPKKLRQRVDALRWESPGIKPRREDLLHVLRVVGEVQLYAEESRADGLRVCIAQLVLPGR